jgi:hypothetical protein
MLWWSLSRDSPMKRPHDPPAGGERKSWEAPGGHARGFFAFPAQPVNVMVTDRRGQEPTIEPTGPP